jgi:hypothetical protein
LNEWQEYRALEDGVQNKFIEETLEDIERLREKKK